MNAGCRHGPEGSLSREAQRVHFSRGTSFYIKAVVVPANRAVDLMHAPLLEQPPLRDANVGRGLGALHSGYCVPVISHAAAAAHVCPKARGRWDGGFDVCIGLRRPGAPSFHSDLSCAPYVPCQST